MRKKVRVTVTRPQFSVTTGIAFAQVDEWFGHTRRDLKLDLIYPEDREKKYPCVVWICGGAWLSMDRSAHLAYLSKLALEGFVVASVEYRTTNDAKYPTQLQDVKAAIRYLRAHADRYHIDEEHIGVTGESAGGHLTCMAALDQDKVLDVGAYLEYSSAVQAACPWYPPTDFALFHYPSEAVCASSPESLLLGKNTMTEKKEARSISPISKISKDAPPFLIIHGTDDHIVDFRNGEALYEALEKEGCDVTLIAIEGADHASLPFFQDDIWNEMIAFFKRTLV